MRDPIKRITLTVRLEVSVTVMAQRRGDEVTVISVQNMQGLPSAGEVMEALDNEGDFAQLDEAYENAIEGLTP